MILFLLRVPLLLLIFQLVKGFLLIPFPVLRLVFLQKGRIFPQLMPLWKSFPLKLILLQTQGFLPLMYPWGMFPHIEITTLMVEAVLVEEKASAEEEVPKGLGSAIGGTSVKATTPLKEGASTIRSQPKGTPFSTPLPVISLDDPFTSLP